ncbi:MAG: hypothetical protein Fues2KO_34430 [Fuerstiella sp.]
MTHKQPGRAPHPKLSASSAMVNTRVVCFGFRLLESTDTGLVVRTILETCGDSVSIGGSV